MRISLLVLEPIHVWYSDADPFRFCDTAAVKRLERKMQLPYKYEVLKHVFNLERSVEVFQNTA